MYTTILPHDKLIKRLCNVIDFVFEGGNRTHICISKNNVAYWGKYSKDNIAFSKTTLRTSLKHLIQNEYMSEHIPNDKANVGYFHATKRFIDDLGTLNDGCVLNDIYKGIYPSELQLNVEHAGTHVTFLNLYITIKDVVFIYKLFDKRDAFSFFIVRMPYNDSNNPKSIFYSALVLE